MEQIWSDCGVVVKRLGGVHNQPIQANISGKVQHDAPANKQFKVDPSKLFESKTLNGMALVSKLY